MVEKRTPLAQPYREDCEQFARSLHPQICAFFFDWACVNFPYGQPIYVRNDVTISSCYGTVHKSYSAISHSGSKLRDNYRKTETQALARWKKQLAVQAAIQRAAPSKEVLEEVSQRGQVVPKVMLEELLASYTRSGTQWGEIWQKTLGEIAQGIAEEVAKVYVKNNGGEVVRLMGIRAASDHASAAIMLSEALEGKRAAYAGLTGWPDAIDMPIKEIAIGSIQAYLTEKGRVATKNRRTYTYEKQSLHDRLDKESQAVGLFRAEMDNKFFKGQKSELYARMALRLSPRDLALVAYTGRIKCDAPLRAELIKPIVEEMNRALAELKARLQPMTISWTTPEFVPQPTKEAV